MNRSGDGWRPTEPPQSARDFGAVLLSRAKQHAAVEKAILTAVGSRGRDAPRDERRRLLEEELQQRSITRDPIWIEQRLDDLETSGLQRVARKRDAIRNLAGLASSLRSNWKDELPMPEWMRPPADAQVDVCSPLFGAPRASERSAIVLNSGIDSLLERAVKESPMRAGRLAAGVVVWFDRAPSDEQQVVVYLGRQAVGKVSPVDAPAVGKSVDAAAQHGERPQGQGVLSKADQLVPPYVLVATLPARRVAV